MKILYGVSGEGFGHSSRASVVAKYLEEKGHEVLIVTYGQGYKALKGKFNIFKTSGLHLFFSKGILDIKKTIKGNLKGVFENLSNSKKFHKLMKEFNPDLCISDMEPIVPILSFWYKKPLISLDNQHRLTNLKLDVPEKYRKDFFLAREVVRTFVRKADYFIVTSFSKEPVKNKNTILVPPIIRKDVQNLKPKKGNKVLVYLTKKDKSVIKTLKEIDEKFVVYGYNINKKSKNLEFKTKKNFLEDLRKCKAIIATAGFTLMSEAIYLKKPYLALPLKGQFEQTLNALFLKKAGFGEYSENLRKEEVLKFLNNLGKYENKLKKNNLNQERLFKILDRVLKNY